MDERTMIYLGTTSLIAILLLLSPAQFGGLAAVVALLVILTIMVILVLNYADFVLFPVFTQILGIKTVPVKNYYIPKTSNSIVKYINGIYYATGYLTANIYKYVFTAENVDENEEIKMSEGPEKWERIVMNAGFPFRYNVLSSAEDVQRYREELEGRRGTLEFQLSKEMSSSAPNELTIQDLQRKMNVVDARIDRLSGGERPIDSVMYIETTAVGVSEKEAADALTNQLNHLQTLFSSFDLSITRVVGRELYHLFTYNYTVPDRDLLGETFSLER